VHTASGGNKVSVADGLMFSKDQEDKGLNHCLPHLENLHCFSQTRRHCGNLQGNLTIFLSLVCPASFAQFRVAGFSLTLLETGNSSLLLTHSWNTSFHNTAAFEGMLTMCICILTVHVHSCDPLFPFDCSSWYSKMISGIWVTFLIDAVNLNKVICKQSQESYHQSSLIYQQT